MAEAPVSGPSCVTGLVPDRRASGYLVVEVDGARFASLSAEVVRDLRIGAGVSLSPEGFAALSRAADSEAAYRVAVRLLAARPRSAFELRQRLRAKGHSVDAVEAATARLRDGGYLDDLEYARNFIEVRVGRGHGRSRILADLQRRGIDRAAAERILASTLDALDVDEREQIERLIAKRQPGLAGLPVDTQRRRLLGYLARRGFGGHGVLDMVNAAVADTSSD